MIRTLLFLAIAVLLETLAGPALAQEQPLRLATEGAYPPFNNKTAGGGLEGFDVDIGNALCAEMKVTCEWVVQDWDGMIPALQAGKFDAIVASMFITEERKKQVDFTNRYYRTPAAVVVPKDSTVAGISAGDLAGKTIGVQNASVYAIWVEKFLPDTAVKAYPSVQEILLDLSNGRLDAANDDLVVINDFLETPQGACCKIVGTIEPIPEIHGPGAGIAVRKGDPLAPRLNDALAAIRTNGVYKRINDKYFAFDLYGGHP
jgi:polar amino acid transport system substrate-binding protein